MRCFGARRTEESPTKRAEPSLSGRRRLARFLNNVALSSHDKVRFVKQWVQRFVLGSVLVMPLLAGAQQGGAIRGAGATYPADVYAAWGAAYAAEKKIALQYQPVGSGEGVKRIAARQVDFGASDEPLSSADLQKNNLVQFPTVVGALVPAFNVRGVKSGELRLTGVLLAKIFAGEIKTWNDPQILAANSGLALPRSPIRVVVREDASGSTRAFTRYLASQDASWATRVGQRVEWPSEVTSARGTKGVAEVVKATEGAIGYVSFQEVRRQSLAAPQLQNRDGKFVLPSERAIQSAVNASEMSKAGDETASLIDLRGTESWPITETTYVLLPRRPADVAQAKRVLNFFYWVFAQGDRMAQETGFVPLPTRIQARLLSRLKEVTGPDGRPLEFLGGVNTITVASSAGSATATAP